MNKKKRNFSGLFENLMPGSACFNKSSKSRISIIFIFIFLLAFLLTTLHSLGPLELDVSINGFVNGFSSDFNMMINDLSDNGYDEYDIEVPSNPSNYSSFFSIISGYNLSIDSWNNSGNPRTLNLSYTFSTAQSGTINFSWNLMSNTQYNGLFIFYLNKSNYSGIVATRNMRLNNSYNDSLLTHSAIYIQVNITSLPSLNVYLNSSDSKNTTLSNITCFANLTHPEGKKMNLSVQWYKNNATNLTFVFNNDYANGSLFMANLHNGNTTKNESWICSITAFDGVVNGTISNSSAILILNSIPTVTQLLPDAGSNSTNRTAFFNWSSSDSDNDTLTFDINITCFYSPGGRCQGDDRIHNSLTGDNYAMTAYLKKLRDNNYYYNWTIRAYDGQNYSNWSSARNFSIQSSVTLSLPVYNNISFGNLTIGQVVNTTTGPYSPIVIRNDGNVEINISGNFTHLFINYPNPTTYYQYKIRNLTSGCFDYPNTVTSWTNAPAPSSNVSIIKKLNFTSGYQSGCNNASLDIMVIVPPSDEEAGNKSSTITITGILGENMTI
ncbi:MAG: hypothetical protein Q8N99_01765 [Nanoarchaeota archaeon]|nr:hypothetical protein [Nanoarchaeota archaeon]